jgi:hypothetical protein
LLIDNRFFMSWRTTKTSKSLMFRGGERVTTWVIDKEASLPTTTQSLPL